MARTVKLKTEKITEDPKNNKKTVMNKSCSTVIKVSKLEERKQEKESKEPEKENKKPRKIPKKTASSKTKHIPKKVRKTTKAPTGGFIIGKKIDSRDVRLSGSAATISKNSEKFGDKKHRISTGGVSNLISGKNSVVKGWKLIKK